MATVTTTAPAFPAELTELFDRAVTAEYASRTRAGAPVTVPVAPYLGEDGRTLDLSTGLTYPVKAERARRDPRVALLYGDPLGSGLEAPPVALVQGLATVRDADLQAGTDRYVRRSMAKMPETYARMPRVALRRMSWYYARIWVEVTPLRVTWWPAGRLDEPPRVWEAPAGTEAPPSDPAPAGGRSPGVHREPGDWRLTAAEDARLALRDLTVIGADGLPVVLPLREVEPVGEGFRVRLPAGAGLPATARDGSAPACLTLHTHSVPFTSQRNRAFAGTVRPEPGAGADVATVVVARRLATWELPAGALRGPVDFLAKGRRLRRNLEREAARRGQAPPVVRFPGETR